MGFFTNLWTQYGATHPLLSHGLVALTAPWLWAKAEEQIPKAVNWAEEYQDRALRKAGLSEEQIIAVDERELKDMRAAADAFEKEIAERKAKLAAPAAATPGAPVAPA
ncbi:MAG: hypothetical protein V4510_13550 [bacterium]